MINGLTDSDRYLYHYTKARTAVDHILKDYTLRMGPYAKTNDPKETKSWQFDLGTNQERDLGAYRMSELSDRMNKSLKSKTSVLCFSKDERNLTGSNIDDVTKRGFMKPRMWAQYADNHRGVCLVIDKAKMLQSFDVAMETEPLSVHGPVQYVNRSFLHGSDGYVYTISVDHIEQHGFEQFCWDYIRQFYRTLFFEKMTDWSTEHEYRCIAFRDSEESLYLDIRSCLVGILIGESADPADVETIQELASPNGVEIMGISWKNGCPWYDYGNPVYSPALRQWGQPAEQGAVSNP